MSDRRLYIASFNEFLEQERLTVMGALHNKYHGDAFHPSVCDDQIYNPLITGADKFQDNIEAVLIHAHTSKEAGIIENWHISPCTPTLTIIGAARTLYENHSVEDITRHETDNVSTDRLQWGV